MKKTFFTICVVLTMIMLMTSCVNAGQFSPVENYQNNDRALFDETAENYYDTMKDADEETFDDYMMQYASDNKLTDGFKKVKTIRSDGKKFIEYGCYNLYQIEDGSARIYKIVKYEDMAYMIILGFDESLDWNYFDVETISEGPYTTAGDNPPEGQLLNLADYCYGDEIEIQEDDEKKNTPSPSDASEEKDEKESFIGKVWSVIKKIVSAPVRFVKWLWNKIF